MTHLFASEVTNADATYDLARCPGHLFLAIPSLVFVLHLILYYALSFSTSAIGSNRRLLSDKRVRNIRQAKDRV